LLQTGKSALRPLFALAPPNLGALSAFTVLVVALAGCATVPQESNLQRFTFESPQMGTLFTITLYATNTTAAHAAAQAAFRRVAALEQEMSDYRVDSELNLLCERPPGQPVPISADLCDIFQKAGRISELSNGAFDITVGPFVRLWRFSRKRKTLPTPAELEQAKAAVGWRKLRLDAKHRTATLLVPNMRLDLGGIAKGYAADEALRVLAQFGIRRAMVAASGDFAIGDPPPGLPGWKIGITAIDERNNRVDRLITLSHCGISTSGDTEQAIEIDGVRYSHIVDPHTGLGLTNRIQASVIAPNATTTDALATAVCVMGVERSIALVKQLPKVGALILTKEGDENHSFVVGRFVQFSKR
jgi:thiamine biosynthesis lipoprotein